jgi:N6-adenosine-specific RNA methylase IME4
MYRGMLTWVKPSLGLGNYFRGTTEHVLFGIRGKLKLRSTDIVLPSCQYRRRRNTGSRSILRPPRRSASRSRRRSSPAPTR